MAAYRHVREKFVETNLSRECINLLKTTRIAILTGQQGCGKTLTAVYIMESDDYKEWKKVKIISYEDLLALEIENDTIVYIDNILDEFLYREKVQKWWDSLCYFYFKHLKSDKNVRLLITAKDNVIKEACKHIREDIVESTFFFRAEMYPFTYEEKLKILKSQFKLAEEMKIENPTINSKYDELKDKTFPIGFPLCAHLYAFEPDMTVKTTAIFDNPKSYVIHHITAVIEKDKSHEVKTLFLYLLFHLNQHGLEKANDFDLKSEEMSQETLKEMASEDLLEKMKPLNFNNLFDRALSLKETILIQINNVFAFKHHIYLEGVSDYFFRKYPEQSVQHFPLDILRTYTFPDASSRVWDAIKQRLKKEMPEGIPEVLSCEIFMKPQFEREFSEELRKDGFLPDLVLNPTNVFKSDLPLLFWASKLRRSILLKETLNGIYPRMQELDDFFYQIRFGECCEKDEKYVAQFSPLNAENRRLDELKQLVLNFRYSEGKSIMCITLSSYKPDQETHHILTKLLNDDVDDNLLKDSNILTCAMEHTNNSRILCILEILQRQNDRIIASKKVSMSTVVEAINSNENNTFLDLEFLVRICILFAYGAIRNKTHANIHVINEKYKFVKELLLGKTNQHTKMARIITKCKEKYQGPSRPTPNIRKIPGKSKLGSELEQAVIASIEVLFENETA